MKCTTNGCNNETDQGEHKCPICIVFSQNTNYEKSLIGKGRATARANTVAVDPIPVPSQKAIDEYMKVAALGAGNAAITIPNRRASDKPEFTGSHVEYYRVFIADPKRPEVEPYMAECEDIIEALNMTFAEGSAFKAIWRSAAARTLGLKKQGQDEHGVYDAEKVSYYGQAMVRMRKRLAAKK